MNRIERILQIMQNDPRTRDAPVYLFESAAKNDFQILVSTLLSARTKDSTSIPIVNRLFRHIKTPEDILKISKNSLENSLYGIGFYRTKTKYLISLSRKLIDDFDSSVPSTLDELLLLPGVGKKTANIVLARAFGKNTIGVDVHVHRISNRLGIVKTTNPDDTEKKLVCIVPERLKRSFNKTFVAYGQTICLPRKPKCNSCKLNAFCPKVGLKKQY
jgi:endonuclease-3